MTTEETKALALFVAEYWSLIALALFAAGVLLGRYSRDLYWCDKAWPSPYPTRACARGRLYWVADSDSPEDCERLLHLLESERAARDAKRAAATAADKTQIDHMGEDA